MIEECEHIQVGYDKLVLSLSNVHSDSASEPEEHATESLAHGEPSRRILAWQPHAS